MRISVKKLQQEGFEVEWDEKRQELCIHGRAWSPRLHDDFEAFTDALGLSAAERDEASMAIWNIQVVSVLKRM